jgi:hypothetical protein
MLSLGLRRGDDVVVGWPTSETPELRPRASWRCFETPLRGASGEAGRWAGLLTRLAGGLARENLARRFLWLILSFSQGRLIFGLLFGGRVVFHLNLGTPNCGTR